MKQYVKYYQRAQQPNRFSVIGDTWRIKLAIRISHAWLADPTASNRIRKRVCVFTVYSTRLDLSIFA